MEVMHERCAALDVHKETVVATVRLLALGQQRTKIITQTFGTKTNEILALSDWLRAHQVTIVAMESTGVYWKPIWNLLESQVELLLVNARDVKQVPGRKSDLSDSQWLAQLLACGLLRPSFVPPKPQRELRDLTRLRWKLLQDKVQTANRIQKVLEDANIKLASVASDPLGISGRDMITALIEGRLNAAEMANLARKRLRGKIPELTQALIGKVNEHHRFLLKMLMAELENKETQIQMLDQRIQEVMSDQEKQILQQLDDLPGVDQRAAENIIAEIGSDMSRFPSPQHLASWAGLCPGNRQSGKKRGSGRMMQGNRWLKATLNQVAWAASRKKDSFFQSFHRRISLRRGGKRATMAVAHRVLDLCWHLISTGKPYVELGGDYLDRKRQDHTVKKLKDRLENLGYKVSLEPQAA